MTLPFRIVLLSGGGDFSVSCISSRTMVYG
uniref:Uncharacterized protein n=1 Tax=Arundo donax TaxID=35708 RepID=A0A0A9AWP8_ARUDO